MEKDSLGKDNVLQKNRLKAFIHRKSKKGGWWGGGGGWWGGGGGGVGGTLNGGWGVGVGGGWGGGGGGKMVVCATSTVETFSAKGAGGV